VPPRGPVSASISARIIHAALVLGVLMFWLVAWYIGQSSAVPADALPERKVLYVALALVSAMLFGGAMFTAARLGPIPPGTSQDDWWRDNLGKAIVIWSLVEAPSLLGLVAYTLTRDFRTLIATFIGLLFFGSYRPSRLIER
jgi:heme A synthase